METIKIKYFAGASKVLSAHPGEWHDLSTACYMTINKGEFALIHLGVAMKLPEGYEAFLVPRSSTFKNYGIIQTNGIGVIDNAYSGDKDEWKMPVYATKNVVIPKGARIAQFRIVRKEPEIIFEEVEHLDDKNRGGFGSSGV